jgi:gliding motility-associated-like protein/uncharacterized repeat protein (TIGR01451 family)
MKSYIHKSGMSQFHVFYWSCFFLLKDILRNTFITYRTISALFFFIYSFALEANNNDYAIFTTALHSEHSKDSYNQIFKGNSVIADQGVENGTALAPAISLNVTADPNSISEVGETIIYTYTVNNIGDETLTEVEVFDDVFESIALTSTIIEPEGSVSGSFDYTVSQEDIDVGGEIVNNASVISAEGAENNNSVIVSVIQFPELSVVKSALTTGYSSRGDLITYSIDVINSGNTTLTNVSVDDPLTGLNETIPNLAPTALQNFLTTYEIRQPDLIAGNVTNMVTVSDGVSVNADAEETVFANLISELSIIKTASPETYDEVGDVIDYTIFVSNTGNVTLTNITVDDPLTGLNVTIPSLSPDVTEEIPTTYTIEQDDINAGSFTNTVTAFDGNEINVSADAEVTASLNPMLSVTKIASPQTYDEVGDDITYTIVVENTGNVTLNNIDVEDPLTGLSTTIPSLAPGDTQDFIEVYTIEQSDINAGSITNTTTASDGGALTVSADAEVTAEVSQDLSITKTASPETYDEVGDEITYTIVVENTGNVTLSNIDVEDPLTGLLTTIPSLAPGDTQDFIEVYTIEQSDINTGSLINTATASDGGTLTVSADAEVTAEVSQDLSITKTASPETYDEVGDEITYIIVVENTGNVTLSNIDVEDPLTGLSTTIPSLAPGDTQDFIEVYTIEQSDINAGSLTNIATASDGGTLTVSADAEVTAEVSQDLSITKTASPETYDEVGDEITYTIVVENTGNVTLNNIDVEDPLTGLSTTIPSLTPGDAQDFIEIYTIEQSDINAGSLINTATASDGGTLTVSADAVVTAEVSQDLSITKTASPETYDEVGDEITYTIVVENTGNVTLNNIDVEDPLTGLSTTIPSLAPGDTQDFIEIYTIEQSDINAGSLTNIATASDGGTLTVSAEAEVTAEVSQDLSITKTASPETYDEVGDEITYTIVVENTGNVTLNNIDVEDPLTGLSTTIPSLAPGDTQDFIEVYTIEQSDINAGSLINTATASDGGTLTVSADAEVTAEVSQDLSITKTASPNTYSSVGQEIDFTITVENSGNVTLSNITVTDPMLDLSETIPNLTPGGTQSFTETYIITQADLNTGSLTNTATASDGNTINVSDNVTISATQSPGITITKTASPATYNSVGDVINYTIVIENTGNVVLSGVTVSDQLLDLEGSLGNLAAGESVTIEESYSITQADLNNGSLTNTASVAGNDTDGQPVSDSDEVTVTASQNHNLVVRKTASPIIYDSVGDEITYTIEVENTGNVVLLSVNVTDQLIGLSENILILAPGETRTYTESLIINQSHLNSGSVTNTVSVTGIGSASIVVNDTDNATVTAVQRPALSVSKTATQETYKAVGDVISYTILTENTGNVTITNVTVNDPLVQLNENIGSLNPGDSHSISYVYSVSQADLDEGTVINIVEVTGNHGNVSVETDDEAVVTALFPPVANDDVSSDHIAGNVVEIAILENDLLNDGSQAVPGLVTVDLNLEASGIQSELVVQNEGVWNYIVQSGMLTFTPQAGFTTDPSPVTYLLTEVSTGLSDNASVTVDYNEGEPFAFNDNSTGNFPGEAVTINILANDKLSDGSAVSTEAVTVDLDASQSGIQTEYSVPGEGNWVYNPQTGEVVFTPLPGYSTNPTPLTYILTEIQTGLSDDGTVIVGYDEQPPLAEDDISAGHVPGDVVTVNILANDKLGDGTQAVPELVVVDLNLNRAGVQDQLIVAGEGTWNLNSSTGDVTFTPLPGFSGSTEPVTYRLMEILTGLGDNGTITIVYNDEAPLAVDDSSSGNQPGTEVSLNILENDVLSDGTPASPDLVTVDLDPLVEGLQHELNIEGQGTWMYNAVNGMLIFTPQSGFFSDPSPVSYTLCSIWNSEVCSEAEVVIDYEQDASSASIGLVKTGVFNSDDETIDYSFEVTNTGNLPVWNINITDVQIGITNLRIIPDTLQPGDAGTVNATYQVTLSDKNEGSVTNSAMAAGFIVNGDRIEDISGRTVNDDEPTVTPLIQAPSILVEKQAVLFSPEAILNEAVDFNIIVTNNGNVILDNVRIEDPLTGFTVDVGELLPGSSADYITEYIVQPEDELNGEFENTAIATGIAPDGSEVTDSSTVVVEVEQCEMVIPNGFSPNDDGIQDTWQIKCLEKYPNARVEIFNRWGNRVYEKRNYGNTDVHGIADAWWDGYSTSQRTFGSGKLPAGTYYYILYLQDGQEPVNGYIFLNR